MFKERGVRFIAIANGVDSDKRESSEFAPFLNIMNEWYVRDSSRKITSVLHARGMSGKHTNSHCIYGYKKDPNDKDHWIIDEEAAEVVRRIYRMALESKGPYEIARILALEKVERPSYYLAQRGVGKHQSNFNPAERYTWRGGTVADILSKPEYMGHTVNFRTYKESYKDKRSRMTPKEDLVIFENTQEAIIDKETWERVQSLRKTIRRTDTIGAANPLTGLMFCADCGAKMYNHRGGAGLARDWAGRPNGRKRPERDEYNCSRYDLGNQHYNRYCTTHLIRTAVVNAVSYTHLDVYKRQVLNLSTAPAPEIRNWWNWRKVRWAMWEDNLIGAGTASTLAWNGVPALYHGAMVNPVERNHALLVASLRVFRGSSLMDLSLIHI